MSEWTKGPWEFKSNHTCHTVKTKGEWIDGARQVCNIPSPRNPESLCNARLIAAAPELYEALLGLASLCRSYVADYEDWPAYQRAVAAAGKAEGK